MVLLSPAIVEPLLKWYASCARVLPWRENRDPYRIWISEIMLQQTRVEAVVAYYERFMAELPDVRALASVSEERLLKLWEGLGYYSRARNLKRAAEMILDRYGGKFPEEAETLAELPGVGPYTAGAIASIAFEQPEPAVDGNVLRVFARLTADAEPVNSPRFRDRVAAELRRLYPERRCGAFTQALMELGAMVCLPNGAPLCERCPLAEFCIAFRQNRATDFPVRPAPKPRRVEQRTILLWCVGDRIGVRQRPKRGLLGGMWEFPGVDGVRSASEVLKESAAYRIDGIVPCPIARHVFTHIEWRMTGFLLIARETPTELKMVNEEELTQIISLPAAFRPFAAFWKRSIETNVD